MPSLWLESDFAKVNLDATIFDVGAIAGRIYHRRYPQPLGFGKTPSRFSDPSPGDEPDRFGVLYLGATLKVCFIEAILRDARNGAVGDYPMEWDDLASRRLAEITPTRQLRPVDLRGDGAVRMGVPSDVVGAADQTLSRAWYGTFYKHPSRPDGIAYPSRLNQETNFAIYGRAVPSLAVQNDCPLMEAPGLADVLDTLKVSLLPPRRT